MNNLYNTEQKQKGKTKRVMSDHSNNNATDYNGSSSNRNY